MAVGCGNAARSVAGAMLSRTARNPGKFWEENQSAL
jgi:hypothetical protein